MINIQLLDLVLHNLGQTPVLDGQDHELILSFRKLTWHSAEYWGLVGTIYLRDASISTRVENKWIISRVFAL